MQLLNELSAGGFYARGLHTRTAVTRLS